MNHSELDALLARALREHPSIAEYAVAMEDEVQRLREALELAQKVINIPPEMVLDDSERVRRVQLVVDTALRISEFRDAA